MPDRLGLRDGAAAAGPAFAGMTGAIALVVTTAAPITGIVVMIGHCS